MQILFCEALPIICVSINSGRGAVDGIIITNKALNRNKIASRNGGYDVVAMVACL